jgi:hypothetical protein
VIEVSNEPRLGLKVFSATKAREREFLGETITDWIRTHPKFKVFDRIVTQSSDAEFSLPRDHPYVSHRRSRRGMRLRAHAIRI